MKTDQPILLVDDDENDLFLMRVAFQQAGVHEPHTVTSAEQAMAYLLGQGAWRDRTHHPLPVIRMLDLNMPLTSGFELLQWVRSDPDRKRLCVVVLSASARFEDVERAFDLGANAYFVKPGDLDDLTRLVSGLHQCLRFAHFPALARRC